MHAKLPKWLNRQVFGWAMYDFANQAFTLVILTAVFNVYFTEYIVPGDAGVYYWSAAGVATQVLIIVLGPILGALADFSGAKKRLLFITWIGCVIFTSSLGLVPPGAVVAGMTLFIISYLFYAGGENFMASFLPELAAHELMGRVSAFGWMLGYCGGLLCLGGAAIIIILFDAPTNYRIVSIWAGLFFFASGLPTFLLLKEKKQPEQMSQGQRYLTIGFHRLMQTFRSVRSHRRLFHFLGVMTLYFAGVQIVFWFAGILTRELFEFTQEQSALFILQVTVTAIIGAAIAVNLQDRIGTKRFLLITLAFWTVVVIGAAFARQKWMFWIVGNGVGLGIGAIGTASRAMVGLFSPQYKAAEFFGFFGFAHKLSAIVGLTAIALSAIVGLTAIATGYALLQDWHVVVGFGSVFFIAGFVLLLAVDEEAGREAALDSQEEFEKRQRDARPGQS